MKWYDWYWTIWLTLFMLAFLALELPSVFSGHPERTLSWWVWKRLESFIPGVTTMPWTWNHWLFIVLWFGLFAWLAVHFSFGWIR